jgi:PleD family two-component response regulator
MERTMKWADSLAKLNSYDAIVAQEVLSQNKAVDCGDLDVLIVTDSRSNYLNLSRDLDQRYDFDVMATRARTLHQAACFLREETFDLVLLDGELPAADLNAILALVDGLALASPAVVFVDGRNRGSDAIRSCPAVRIDEVGMRLNELLDPVCAHEMNGEAASDH